MLRLFTFGGLGLETDDGSPTPHLRRPQFAVLAVLAASGERGVSRERVASLFWSDSDEEHARHSARQVLYALRQELGEVVRSSGSTLKLDPDSISSDVAEFRSAIAAGDRERAIGLSKGVFLDGFYLPGAAAFERWVEEERGRLASAKAAALLSLATDATRAGNFDASVDWWRQLTATDPLSGRYAVGFLKALAARGDRAEALSFARQHELVMRRELEAEPDPDVRKIEAELRAIAVSPAGSPNGGSSDAPAAPRTGNDTGAPDPGPAQPVPPNPVRRGRRRTLEGVAAIAMLLMVVTAAFGRQRGWFRAADAPPSPPTFAVGMIREEGVPDSQHSGRVITDMIATNLSRVEGMRVLANSRLLELLRPGNDLGAAYAGAARRAGATDLLEGEFATSTTGAMELELRRVELRTGIVRDVYRAAADNRYALVDSVTRLVGSGLELTLPSGSVADATTHSLVAYRFYEEGLRALQQGDAATARRLMHAALDEDSSFAIAAWYEALLAEPLGKTPDGRPLFEARRRALRLAERAPLRERLTILASILTEDQEPAALAVAESLATKFPDDPRGLMTLGRTRISAGDWAGARDVIERAIAIDSAAEVSDTGNCRVCEGFHQLADVYYWWDSLPAVQRTARRYLALRPDKYVPYYFLALSSARQGDSTGAYAAINRLNALGASSADARFAVDLTLESYDAVAQGVRPLLGSASASDWGNAAWYLFIALRNQGRMREATAFARTGWIPGLPILNLKPTLHPYHLALALVETGQARQGARAFASMPIPDPAEWAGGIVSRNLAWRGTLTGMALAAAGDTVAVRAMADSVERWGRGSIYARDRTAHHYLRGMLYAAAGRPEDAIREFRAALFAPSLGFTRVNYELAKTLLAVSRPQDAVAALQPALRGAVDASNLYITRTELHELLADAFVRANRPDSAAKHYRAVVRAWEHADPMFAGRRERAAAWLARYAPSTKIASH